MENVKLTPIMESLKLQKIDDQEYFSERYNGYISNSRLSLIDPNRDGTPEKFFEGLGKNKIYSDALILGSAVHELILQPDLFELVETVDRTTAKLGFMHDYLYKYYLDDSINADLIIQASNEIGYFKNRMTERLIMDVLLKGENYWRDRHNFESQYDGDKELIFLDPKMRERLKESINALNNNEKIQTLLHPTGLLEDPISENEQAILLDVLVEIDGYEPFIFKIKAKLDNYTIDKETNTVCVNDLKTIGKVLSEFNNNFEQYNYYRELTLYSWLLSLVAKKYYDMENPTVKSNCLVVSTIPAYYTKVYEVTKADFKKGWDEFLKLLKLAANYYTKGYRFE